MASSRDASRPFARCALGGVLLALGACLGGCEADIPDGVYACDRDQDCPSGFSCRAKESGEGQYCFARDDQSASGKGGGGDGAGDGGTSESGRGGSGAGSGARGGSSGSSGSGATGGSSGDGGTAGTSGTGGTGGRGMPDPVAPTRAGFSTLGQRRGTAGWVVYDDGFERGGRLCTADGKLCATGGFTP